MKNLFYTLALALVCHVELAQNTNTKVRQTFRDSVADKYLKNGAWHYLIFSHEWEKYIDTAIGLDPTNGYLWQQRAMPYFKCGKYEVGMKYLDKAVDANPDYLDYRAFNKCIFCKSYENAIADFEKAKSVKGQSYIMDRTYDFYLGLCYLQLDKFDKAEEYFKSSIAFQTKKTDDSGVSYLDWFYLGVTYYEKEDYTLAVKYLDRAIKDYSHFSDAKYYKAKCFIYLNKNKEALELLSESLADIKVGYTINEGNSKYEKYPYQVEKEILELELGVK